LSNLVMEPMLYGRSVGVSEVALLVVVAFWTWLWGPIGLILSTPLTTCLVVLGKYVPQLEFFDVLLGDEPALEPHLSFYQRLLARDQDEASELVEEHLTDKEKSWQSVYDELLLPALILAKREQERGRLDQADYQAMVRMTDDILEETTAAHVQLLAEAEEKEKDPSETEEPVSPLVIGCPGRDAADESALRMFEQLLSGTKCEVEIATHKVLSSEIVAMVEAKKPTLICIASLPPGGLAHTRYLCKRLRTRFPELKILVGRWGIEGGKERSREVLLEAGANQVGFTLQESRQQAIQLLQLLPHLRPVAVA
jgi:hypothetical protein